MVAPSTYYISDTVIWAVYDFTVAEWQKHSKKYVTARDAG